MTLTETFMQALQQTEQSGDVAPLVALFADDATLQNLTKQTWQGADGAREFWQTYLGNFQQIRSEFFHHADDGHTGVMEWDARGQLEAGHDIEYRGTSIILYDGDKVKTFRTYYDSAAFIKPQSTDGVVDGGNF
jgi:ketosteroid isomerase-like protein